MLDCEITMRCYNGCIPESDYKARYGYTHNEYLTLLQKTEFLVTYFPIEGKYSVCLPKESYRSIGPMFSDKMEALKHAIKELEESV